MVNKKVLPILFILWIGYSTGIAQVCLPASGGDFDNSDGSVSFTLGQLFYTTENNSDGKVLEGIQQSYEVISTGVKNTEKVNIHISVYPNPVSHQLVLESEGYEECSLHFELYDAQGKILKNGKLQDNRTEINLNGYPSSVYYLCIIKEYRLIETFKIIKK